MDPSSRGKAREAGKIIYIAYSRRAEGLSLGINLFLEKKVCNFDCPYCEVFPFESDLRFSVDSLKAELDDFLCGEGARGFRLAEIRDICFSGNGEPTLSPFLEEALGAAVEAKRKFGLDRAKIVLITNSTGFLVPRVREFLSRFVEDSGLEIWAKLDGGNAESFERMSRSGLPFAKIVEGLESFAHGTELTIQTMLCGLDGRDPEKADLEDYANLISGMVLRGAKIAKVQLYTYARHSPEGRCSPLSGGSLTAAADLVLGRIEAALAASGKPPGSIPVKRYGSDS